MSSTIDTLPKVVSEGERVMLRAGMSKRDLLYDSFANVPSSDTKSPKMLVVCEDTDVMPEVAKFLKSEGLTWHYAALGHTTFYDWRNKTCQ